MNVAQRDLQHIWHPCSQMKDYEDFPPLAVKSAQGVYIELSNGQKILDAISSWWCKSLGHGHPRLRAALHKQAEQFEHVIFANTTNETIVQLSEKLAQLSPSLDKVFYAGDGSCAIEVALKMALHAQQLRGQPQRNKVVALANGYHGETCLTLSVSDLGIYKDSYQAFLQDVNFLQPLPYVSSMDDPLWDDCSASWKRIEAQLNQQAENLCAIILEPILQGAGGMHVYSQDLLKRIGQWCQANDVYLIADEIMTGFGRTGLPLAIQHANIEADFVCVSKGLTAGWLPFSAVLTRSAIYDLFYDDYATGKSFLHSHTYSGNALGAALALETLSILDDENIYQNVQSNQNYLYENMLAVAQKTGALKNIRHIGWMVAADLITDEPRAGFSLFQHAVKLGALLRPLGNTIYWLPPLNTTREQLDELRDITIAAIESTIRIK